MIRKRPHNSHKTAIVRKRLPQPTKWLYDNGYLNGSILDFGCGKCHEINNKFFVADGYDPYYRPHGINKQKYDVIICNFVLNTIPSETERREIFDRIKRLIVSEYGRNGRAYITVRNDSKKLRGWTQHKTWQGLINLRGVDLIKSTAHWKMYKINRWDILFR